MNELSQALNEGRGRDPGDTFGALCDLRRRGLRSTKAGAETPATLLIGAEHLDGRNPAPVLPTDVVTDPQMPSKPATSHNFEPGGA